MERGQVVAIIAAGAVVVSSALFGGGYLVGRSSLAPDLDEARAATTVAEGRTAAAEARATEEAERLEQALASAVAREEALRRRERLLETRRLLAIALDDLDARNFGMSQDRCAAAATVLAESGTDEPWALELSEQLRDFRFEMGGDFEVSRQQLRAAAAVLDEHVDPPPTT